LLKINPSSRRKENPEQARSSGRVEAFQADISHTICKISGLTGPDVFQKYPGRFFLPAADVLSGINRSFIPMAIAARPPVTVKL
jgi:hypothetical protein